MKNQNAVILFARTPEIPRTAADEPFAALPWEDLDAIFHAALADIADHAAEIPDADVIVYRDERYLPASKFSRPGDAVRILDLPAGEFNAVAGQAVEHAFHEYYHRVAVVLDNNPLIGAGVISRAFDLLGTEDDAAVVASAPDGRVAMLALKSNHPSLFRGNGSRDAGSGGMLARLCELDVHLFPTDPVFLVESPATIDLLRRRISAMDPSDPDYPGLTGSVFRALEKKYRLKKAEA